MLGTIHQEWLNQNSGRAYPFREDCGLLPSDGTSSGLMDGMYRVPDWLVLDFVMSVPAGSAALSGLYMSRMTCVGDAVTIVVSDSDGAIAASVSASTADLENGRASVPFSGSGRYAQSMGAVVFGDIGRLLSEHPGGSYSFQPGQASFETRCVRPSLLGVTSLNATDARDLYATKRLYGDVSLIAGKNITLRYDGDNNAIWISAANDTGYSETCDCGSDEKVIRTINGMSAANVNIIGGECVKVEKMPGVIKISDTCSKPCCGCEELSFLSGKSNAMVTALMKLETLVSQLQSKMSALSAVGASNRVARALSTMSAQRRSSGG